MRSASRAYTLDSDDPGVVLERLSRQMPHFRAGCDGEAIVSRSGRHAVVTMPAEIDMSNPLGSATCCPL
jgi:hypothetical protein